MKGLDLPHFYIILCTKKKKFACSAFLLLSLTSQVEKKKGMKWPKFQHVKEDNILRDGGTTR